MTKLKGTCIHSFATLKKLRMLKKLMSMHRQQEITNENSVHTIFLKALS